MSVVVVTVTSQPPAPTATPTSSGGAPSVSSGAVAGIIIGVLLGGVLLIVLVLYLLNRRRHTFTRVANPAHDGRVSAGRAPDLRYLPKASSTSSSQYLSRHSQRPSMSSEPLVLPASWPPIPSTSRIHSPSTPLPDSLSLDIREGQFSSFDFGGISHVVASGSATPTIPHMLPAPKSPQMPSESPRSGSGDSTPRAGQVSGGSSPSTSPKPQHNLFLHRMLQSRARASEGVSVPYLPLFDFSSSRSTTLQSSGVEERLLAEAESTALRDAEEARKEGEKMVLEEEEDCREGASTESIYSQHSAPIDHASLLSEPVSRLDNTLSLARRKSSRRRVRTPAQIDLAPVAEVPDTPRAPEDPTGSRSVSTKASSSLDAQVSHRTGSRPISPAVDSPAPMPLLTSANFGKGSSASGTPPGSISSAARWGSSSSGRASRYPSLAPSSIGQPSSLRSGLRSESATDWHHPPSGLAGLALLEAGQLRNPHSPVEELPRLPEVLLAGHPAGAKRAHLRQGTGGSVPEVEQRTVVQGGIAHIDVVL